MVLSDPWLSCRHAEIRGERGEYHIYDLGRRNGTILNGVRIREKARLHHGDVITVGDETLTFLCEPANDVHIVDGVGEVAGAVELPADRLLAETGGEESTQECFRRIEQTIQERVAQRAGSGILRETLILRALTHATTALVVDRPLPELLDFILDLVLEVLPADRGFFILARGDPSTLQVRALRMSAKSRRAEPEIT